MTKWNCMQEPIRDVFADSKNCIFHSYAILYEKYSIHLRNKMHDTIRMNIEFNVLSLFRDPFVMIHD